MTLADIAELIGGQLVGEPGHQIDGVASLTRAESTDLSFVEQKKYLPALKLTRAGVVLLRKEHLEQCPAAAIVTDSPYLDYARVARVLFPRRKLSQGIHPTAVVGENCVLGEGVSLAPNAVLGQGVELGAGVQVGSGTFVGDDVKIGRDSVLYPNVTVYHGCRLGERVVLHSGSVIGADGFGYAPSDSGWVGIPQVGAVVLGNNVEIGANTTIDRGAIENTTLGDGVIIDNLVQIGHNVTIGDHTAIAACTAVAGSANIGKRCTIAGAVGIAGHISIADGTHITAMTLVSHSILEAGAYSSGVPMEPNASWHRNAVRFKQLDQMAKRLKSIEKKILSS